jgi:hypothetical protein
MRRHGLRTFTRVILSAAAVCGALADPARADAPPFGCRPCRAPHAAALLVGLPLEDYLPRTLTRLWIERSTLSVQALHHARTGEDVRVVVRFPRSVAELRQELQELADTCFRVEYLGIVSHGNEGYLQIGGEGVSARNVEVAFGGGLACVMAEGATVELEGCNVGRGCRGADFMLAVAERLLPRGGKVVAPEHYVYGNAFLGLAPRSLFAERELVVEGKTALPRFTRGSDRGAACAPR